MYPCTQSSLPPTMLTISSALLGLATNVNNTFLALTNITTQDYSENLVIEIESNFPEQATAVFPDIAPPVLSGFLFDTDAGIVELTFDEVVLASSLEVTQITFTNNVSVTTNYTLTEGTVDLLNDLVLTVTLTEQDLNAIKVDTLLASFMNNTYIDLAENSVFDTAGNGVLAFIEPFPVTRYILDTTRSTLLEWNISINEGEVYFLFSEAMNHLTLDPTLMRFQNNHDSDFEDESYFLTSESYTDTPDGIMLTVNLSRRDLDALKDLTLLATEVNDTYLSFRPVLVRDMARNEIIPIGIHSARQATDVFPDVTRPELVAFNFFLEDSLLVLSFSETVNPDTINITDVVLQNANSNPTRTFQITSSSLYNRTDYSYVEIYLSLSDLNTIKSYYNLGTYVNDTFITIESTTAEDRNDNPVVPILSDNALKVTDFGFDMIRPSLVSFQIDFTYYNLTLSFTETVNVDTLNLSKITFMDALPPNISNTYTLTGGVLRDNATSSDVLVIDFLKVDRDELTLLQPLCTGPSNCYLSHTDLLVNDTMENPVIPITSNEAILPIDYVFDMSSTFLTDFIEFDLDSGLLTILFEEIIDASTIDVTSLRLQNFLVSPQYSVMLSGGDVLTPNGTMVQIQLTNDDLNLIKAQLQLCTDTFNCHLRLLSTFANDTFGNPILPAEDVTNLDDSPTPISLVEDMTPPELVAWDIDLTNETITLYFNETVEYTVFESRFITVQNSEANATESEPLENDLMHTLERLPYIVFSITDDDVINIKAFEELATSERNSYISLTSDMITDTSGNAIVAIDIEDALQVSNYTRDSIVPELIMLSMPGMIPNTLDMNTGVITLVFSEPVNASTFQFDYLTLHNNSLGEGSFTLTGGNISFAAANKDVVEITISDIDLRQIKLRQDLAVGMESSFLSLLEGLILDMAGNPVVEVPSSTPIQPAFIPDTTSPVVLSFELDMNTAELILTFDDVIDISTLAPQFITLQNEQFQLDPVDSYTLMRGSSNSSDQYIITIDIEVNDLNEIKMRDGLATNMNNTFLSLRAATIKEVAGSNVAPILDDDALQVREFREDITRPDLVRFSVDLTSEVLVLVFSEAVNVSSLDLTQITLQDSQNISNSIENYTLTGGIPTPAITGVNIEIALTKFDLDNLKALTMLGTTLNNTHLYLTVDTVLDMNHNPINEISSENAQQAASLNADIIAPILIQYCLDMDGNPFLELTFSETVNVSSLDPTLISLQNTALLPTSSHTLTGGNITSKDEIIVTIYLTLEDSNEIKRIRDLATSPLDTFMSFLQGMVYDNALPRNPIDEVTSMNAISVNDTCYTNDTTLPELLTFDLDLSNDIVVLYFSETVSVLEFNFTGITLIGGRNRFSAQRELISGNLTSGDSHIISFVLTFEDANFIKNESGLATMAENTFILLDNSTLIDMNMNAIDTILAEDAVAVGVFQPDEENPQLVSYDFNLDAAEITLYFTETVDIGSLDVTQITLHDEIGPQYTLSNMSYSDSSNGPVVVVSISIDDLNTIKQIISLATNEDNTFLALTSSTINDTTMNPVIAVVDAQQVDMYTGDITRPRLESFRFDMVNTVPPLLIILTFSETVNASSVNPTEFQLRVSANDTSLSGSYNLAGGNVSDIDSTEITVTVNNSDLEAIRLLPPLGHYVHTTFLAVTEFAVADMARLQLVPITSPAQQASTNDADLVPPFLGSFSFDLNFGVLVLTFSENITFSTLVIPRITLQNDEFLPSEILTLATIGNSSAVQLSGDEIEITLTLEELNRLKQLTHLATMPEDTYISLEANVINDIAENDGLPIFNNSAQQVAEYTPDTTRPRLEAFDLNMRTREITLYFSETVNATSLIPLGIRIVNGDVQYQLTGGEVISSDGPIIIIIVTITDKNEIKARDTLAVSRNTTYIAIVSDTVTDNAGNEVRTIAGTSPLQVSEYTPDMERPSLISFDLDMDEGILLLHFNETVNVSTLLLDLLTLQDNITRDSANHTFTTSTKQEENAPTVVITISRFDLNEIKRKQFCYNRENCYLIFEDEAVYDMVDIPIDGVPNGQAIQVDVFVNDTTSPELEEFTQINLADGIVTLSFSETINASSLDFSAIILMDLFLPHLASVNLTGGFTNDSDGDVIQFILETPDLLEVQAESHLCTHRGNCYIGFSSDLVRDMVGNPIRPVIDEFPGFIVRFFGEDIVRPELLAFAIDLNEGLLTLSFNEPVKASSFDPTGITIRGEANTSNPVLYHRLTGGTTVSSDDPVIIVQLDPYDLNVLKGSVFAKDSNSTFLAIESTTITDNAFTPNDIIPISTESAIPTSNYTADTTSPVLLEYTLDMDSDILILTFNEPINHTSVDCTNITLYNTTSSTQQATLPLTDCLTEEIEDVAGILVITFELVQPDITDLKVNLDFATSDNNSYLSLTASAFVDTAGNPVTPVDLQPVSLFIPDGTRPMLLSFTYDQLLGQINLTFSDVVSANTFDATALTLQHDKYREEGRTFTLSSSSTTMSPDGYIIVVDLSHFDLLNLKTNTALARSENDTYLTIAATLIDDTAAIDVVPITDGKAIQTDLFIPDIVPPILVSYTLDMDLGDITLTFSDTVNLTTFESSGLVLQEALNATASGSPNVLRLTDGEAYRSADGLRVTLNISIGDLNELKRNTNLTTDENNTFLAIDPATILDLAGNELIGISDSSALQPELFIPDSTGPFLLSFNLDMNNGTISLTFDETTNAASITVTEFTLQNDAYSPTESYTLGSGATSSVDNSTEIEIYLSQLDIDDISRLRMLATEVSDTFLSITTFAVSDMNGNGVFSVANDSALLVTNFTADTTPPSLMSYDLDINTAVFTLRFTEVMDYRSFDPTQLILVSTSSESNVTLYTILGGSVQPVDDIVLYLNIDIEDLNEIKRLLDLATSENTTYIAFTSDLVTDTFNNSIINITEETPLQVTEFTPDTTPPEVVSFVLDINLGLLNITFNETVDAASLRIDAITIESSALSPVENYTLQHSTFSREDSTVVIVNISLIDLDSIKLRTLLATHENNTYLTLADGVVADTNGNYFESVTTSGELIPDITSPELLEFVFDLNLGTIVLDFTEAINTTSLNVMGLGLYPSTDTNATNSSFYLSPPSATMDANGKMFNVTLSIDDLNAIKADFNLATQISTTFLAIDPYTLLDMADNPVLPLVIPQQARDFIPDITSPGLDSASFNFNGGLLSLTFSETINVETFVPTEITLQNDIPTPPSTLRLSGGNLSMENSTVVVVTLTELDLNQLKDLPNFFTSLMQAYIAITNTTVQDMSGNMVTAIPSMMALILDDIVFDDIEPELLAFELDMNIGLLTITFSETIDPTQFNVSQLWIQNEEFNISSQFRLTGSASSPLWNLTFVEVYLTFEDLNEIKLLETLAIDENTTYLRFVNSTAFDTTGNPLATLNDSQGIPVSLFTPDTTPPELVSFSLDMDQGSPEQLYLTFSEPVRADSVDFTAITLVSVDNITLNGSEFYTLTNGTVLSMNGLEVQIVLTFIDTVNIQARRSLAIDQASTFISLDTTTVLDMNSNPSVNISDTTAMISDDYSPDTTDPELQEFSVDLDSGVFTLTFTESMDSASVASGVYVLLPTPRAQNIPPSFRLDGSIDPLIASPLDWYIVNITLTFEQLNALRLLAPMGLYTDNETSYLSINFINPSPMDTAGNPVILISDTNAIPASEYVPDVTLPILLDFQFNAEGIDGVITLEFSEPVLLSSLEQTLIEFHNSAHINTSTIVVMLSGGALNTTENGLFLDLILETDDLNMIKSLTDIANSVDDTYIFLQSGAITDVYGNNVSEEEGRTVQASSVRPDGTHPELDSFTFDLDTGVLSLTFSETVNVSTLDPREITLQSAANATDDTYQLTGGIGSTLNQPIVMVNLTIEDLNAVKEIRGLATRRNNTYISITPDAISDMVGFNLTAISPESALRALQFFQDITSPMLLSFTLNLTTEELRLTFDETISYNDTVLTRFTLDSGPNSTYVTLTDASRVSMNDSTIIVISLDTVDLNRIKLDTTLATELGNTRLSIDVGALKDMAGVQNMDQTLGADFFYPDLVSPSLETFLFDLDSGLIMLNFDEAINASTLDISGLTFMDMPNGSVIFQLSDIINNSTNGPRLSLFIIEEDLNIIKQNTSLLTAMANAFLALDPNFIADMNDNPLNAVSGEPAAMFLDDETRPVLISFDLDMNTGYLRLLFSETVNASGFTPTGLTLQSVLNSLSPSSQYTLTGGYLLSLTDDIELTLVIDNDDLNEIKARGIAQDNITTWLAMNESTVRDMSNLPITPLINGVNVADVDQYTNDMTGPVLLNFTLNLTSEVLVLTFYETVDVYSINMTQFTLQNTSTEPTLSTYTLTEASTPVLVHSPIITIELGDEDLNEIKKLIYLGTVPENTFLSFTERAVTDRAGNMVEVRTPNNSIQAIAVFEDLNRPMLTGYVFDLNQGLVTLTFSETVQASSVTVTDFALQSTEEFSVINDTVVYNLTGGTVLSTDGPVIEIVLSDFDLNEIKFLPDLASGAANVSDNTFLTLNYTGVRDNNNNVVFEITDLSAFPADMFLSDITSPALRGFSLDLDAAILTLNFTEAVNGSSLDPTGLTLRNENSTNATSLYMLTNGTVVGVEQTIVEVLLTEFDLNNIKSILDLATSINNTYIDIIAASILDTSENPVVVITPEEAIPVTELSTDSSKPQLRGFDLDVNSGKLTLTFSETVLASSVDPAAITIQSLETILLDSTNSSLFYTLTSGNITALENVVLQLQMTNSDLNQIKRRSRLATAEDSTYLSITEDAVTDANGNMVVPVLSTNATRVSNYTEDSTPPELVSYNLDLNMGELILRFSETVNSSTINLPYFTLQDSCPTPINITNSTNSTNASSYTLTGN